MEESAEAAAGVRRSEIEAFLADLVAGAEVQRALLPSTPPAVPGYDLASFSRAARGVSGDFHDLLTLGGGKVGIAVADASGKGIPAGLLAMACHAFLRAQHEPDASPARALANVNRMLVRSVKPGMFVSAVYAVLDPETHALVVANAGHLPTVVWRSRQRIATTYPARGPALGVVPPGEFEAAMKEEKLALDPGDRLVLLTDGVNEAMAPGRKEFGMEHLRRRLRAESDGPSGDFLRHLVDQIEIHRGGGEQSDDITIVACRRRP